MNPGGASAARQGAAVKRAATASGRKRDRIGRGMFGMAKGAVGGTCRDGSMVFVASKNP